MLPNFTLVACASSHDFHSEFLRAPIRVKLHVAFQVVYHLFDAADPGIQYAYCAVLALVHGNNVSGAYVLLLTQPWPSRTPPWLLVEFQKRLKLALRDIAVLSLALQVDFCDRETFRAALADVYSEPMLLDSNLFSQLCNAASKCFDQCPGENKRKNRRRKKIVVNVRD